MHQMTWTSTIFILKLPSITLKNADLIEVQVWLLELSLVMQGFENIQATMNASSSRTWLACTGAPNATSLWFPLWFLCEIMVLQVEQLLKPSFHAMNLMLAMN